MSNSINELKGADFLLVAGSNTTETHPVIALRIKEAVRHGARLVVVDPRRIEMTRLAHRWLPLTIGTDIPLFNAMAHVIIRERLYDASYVSEKTEGFEELARHLERYTPELAESITGVPADDIVQTAREYATSPRASIVYTLGITEHSCGTHNVQSLANLALLCGNFGKPYAGVNPLRGQNNVQGAGDMGCIPTDFPGYQKADNPAVRARFEKAWGRPLPETRGTTKITALNQILRDRLKCVYIMGENTVVSDAHASHTRAALEHLDFLVVQDIFMTETARLADVVLPAACYAEVDGTFTNTERRVQRVRKAVEPPGEAKPDWLIVSELSSRLGYPMPYVHPSEIWDEVASLVPTLSGISYQRLDREGGLQWPCPTPDHPGTTYLHSGRPDSGTGYFGLVDHIPPAEPPDIDYPLVLTTGRRRPAYHTGTMTRRASGFDLLAPHELAEINPADAAALGVRDGEEVMVVSRRGRVAVKAKVTDRSPLGAVFMSFHFPDETYTNLLTTDACDFITETPEFKACAVRVEKLPVAHHQ